MTKPNFVLYDICTSDYLTDYNSLIPFFWDGTEYRKEEVLECLLDEIDGSEHLWERFSEEHINKASLNFLGDEPNDVCLHYDEEVEKSVIECEESIPVWFLIV